MNSKEYLKNKLAQLSEEFSGIKIRYEYKLVSNSHLIEILPLSLFEGNEDYMTAEELMVREFEYLFADEDLVFVSEGSLTEVKNPEFMTGYNQFHFNIDFEQIECIVEDYSYAIEDLNSAKYAKAA